MPDDNVNSCLVFRRMDKEGGEIIAVLNLTTVTRENYTFGVPEKAAYDVILNSDEARFGGSGMKQVTKVSAKKKPSHGKDYSITLTLPGNSVTYLKKRKS